MWHSFKQTIAFFLSVSSCLQKGWGNAPCHPSWHFRPSFPAQTVTLCVVWGAANSPTHPHPSSCVLTAPGHCLLCAVRHSSSMLPPQCIVPGSCCSPFWLNWGVSLVCPGELLFSGSAQCLKVTALPFPQHAGHVDTLVTSVLCSSLQVVSPVTLHSDELGSLLRWLS